MASTFCDSNQDPPLLYWVDDGPSSPAQPRFVTNHSARYTPELSPVTPASNISRRSLESDSGRRGAQRPLIGKERDIFLSPYDSTNNVRKGRFSAGPIYKDTDATYGSKVDGTYDREDSADVSLDTEIDDLLDDLVGYHSKRTTMTSAHLLPLPEEISPTGGPASPQLYSDFSLLPPVTDSMLLGGDSDTPSLVSSSPRSSKGSHLSPSWSPSLKSKKNFAPITPSTDGWRSPPSLATVLEHEASTSDSFGHTGLSTHPAAWSPDLREAPEDDSLDSYIGASSETRRAHHTNLPPIWTAIPEDSTIRRRAKASISSEQTIIGDYKSRVESLADQSLTSYCSGNDPSGITGMGYLDPGFNPLYTSGSSAVSIRFAQPSAGSPRRPWTGGSSGRYSPTSSFSPGSVDYPPPNGLGYGSSPKRGRLQSLFSQNNSPEQKRERKWSKMRDQVQMESSPPQSTDKMSFLTSSSKSSKDKGKKKAEKAERRAQLAAQLKARQLQATVEKDRGSPSRAPDSQNALGGWEERGGMYSIDGFI